MLKVDLRSEHCRKLSLKRPAKCDTCSGSGTKSGNKSTCDNCQGQGIETVMRQVGPGMITQMQRKCSKCKGAGKSIRPGEPHGFLYQHTTCNFN